MNRNGVDKIIKFKVSFNKLEQKIIFQCSYEKKIGMLVDCKLNVSQQCKQYNKEMNLFLDYTVITYQIQE